MSVMRADSDRNCCSTTLMRFDCVSIVSIRLHNALVGVVFGFSSIFLLSITYYDLNQLIYWRLFGGKVQQRVFLKHCGSFFVKPNRGFFNEVAFG